MTTLVTFSRLAAAPPPERELLTILDDGRAFAWRSTGSAIGRFGGLVPDLDTLRSTAATAIASVAGPHRDAGPLELPPGAAYELVEAGRSMARFEARADVAGPWAPLVGRCRALLDELITSPLAAIAATVEQDGLVRLVHLGPDPLPVELASLEVGLTLWRQGIESARARTTGLGLGRVDAVPGWSLEIAAPDLDLGGGGNLVALASFVADDAGIFVPVTLTAHRAI